MKFLIGFQILKNCKWEMGNLKMYQVKFFESSNCTVIMKEDNRILRSHLPKYWRMIFYAVSLVSWCPKISLTIYIYMSVYVYLCVCKYIYTTEHVCMCGERETVVSKHQTWHWLWNWMVGRSWKNLEKTVGKDLKMWV